GKATAAPTCPRRPSYRWFQQKHIDGNLVDADGCNGPPDVVCFENDTGGFDPVVGPGGRTELFDPDAAYGTLDHTSQNANSWGLSGQGVEKARVLGHPNQFLLGASYDHGRVGYASSSDLGTFGPDFVLTPIDPTFLI